MASRGARGVTIAVKPASPVPVAAPGTAADERY